MSIVFNGINQLARFDAGLLANPNNPFTVLIWYKPTQLNTSGDSYIGGMDRIIVGYSRYLGLLTHPVAPSVLPSVAGYNGSNPGYNDGITPLKTNEWRVAVFAKTAYGFSASNPIKFWDNDAVNPILGGTSADGSAGGFSLGAMRTNSGSSPFIKFFAGKIAHVAIWDNVLLSDEQVALLITDKKLPTDIGTAPSNYYEFAGNLKDSIGGKDLTGINLSAASYDSDTPPVVNGGGIPQTIEPNSAASPSTLQTAPVTPAPTVVPSTLTSGASLDPALVTPIRALTPTHLSSATELSQAQATPAPTVAANDLVSDSALQAAGIDVGSINLTANDLNSATTLASAGVTPHPAITANVVSSATRLSSAEVTRTAVVQPADLGSSAWLSAAQVTQSVTIAANDLESVSYFSVANVAPAQTLTPHDLLSPSVLSPADVYGNAPTFTPARVTVRSKTPVCAVRSKTPVFTVRRAS